MRERYRNLAIVKDKGNHVHCSFDHSGKSQVELVLNPPRFDGILRQDDNEYLNLCDGVGKLSRDGLPRGQRAFIHPNFKAQNAYHFSYSSGNLTIP